MATTSPPLTAAAIAAMRREVQVALDDAGRVDVQTRAGRHRDHHDPDRPHPIHQACAPHHRMAA